MGLQRGVQLGDVYMLFGFPVGWMYTFNGRVGAISSLPADGHVNVYVSELIVGVAGEPQVPFVLNVSAHNLIIRHPACFEYKTTLTTDVDVNQMCSMKYDNKATTPPPLRVVNKVDIDIDEPIDMDMDGEDVEGVD